jgi:hypothetical protein
MPLASAGDIEYVGISTSSSIPSYDRYMSVSDLATQRVDRLTNVQVGRASGFRRIPDPVAGSIGHLERPASGIIEDSEPLVSPGSKRINEAANAAHSDNPLVVIAGGPLMTVASAWLTDRASACWKPCPTS